MWNRQKKEKKPLSVELIKVASCTVTIVDLSLLIINGMVKTVTHVSSVVTNRLVSLIMVVRQRRNRFQLNTIDHIHAF